MSIKIALSKCVEGKIALSKCVEDVVEVKNSLE